MKYVPSCDAESFFERFNKAVTDAHCLANMLDARYMGRKLSCEQKQAAMRLMKEAFPEFMPTYIKFSARTFPFSPEELTKEAINASSPLELWKYFENQLNCVSELRLPRILFTAVASSAGLERVFSSFGLVQSDLRNRLGNDKASKLVSIYRHYNH